MASIGGTGGDHLPIGHKHVEETSSSESFRGHSPTHLTQTARKVGSIAVVPLSKRPPRPLIPPLTVALDRTSDQTREMQLRMEAEAQRERNPTLGKRIADGFRSLFGGRGPSSAADTPSPLVSRAIIILPGKGSIIPPGKGSIN
jgi:hypothetical protein